MACKPNEAENETYKTLTELNFEENESPLNVNLNFDVLLTVHLSIFISVINQLDAQNFCFTISLFHASTCFEHMCPSSRGQNCIQFDDTRGRVMQF